MVSSKSLQTGKTLFTVAIIAILCSLLVTPMITAFEWDNVKSYDESTKTYTITNALGLGEKIAEVQLISPLIVYVGYGAEQVVAEFELRDYDVLYGNAFQDMNFYQINNNMKEFDREFKYEYKTTETENVTTWEEQCSTSANGTYECFNVDVGEFEQEVEKWEIFSDINELPQQGSIRVRIVTYVEEGDYVEWIPVLFGEYLDEWAIWSASIESGLISWWTLNESSGNTIDVIDDNDGSANGSITYEQTGVINFSTYFDGVDVFDMGRPAEFDLDTEDMTISLWMYPTGASGSGVFMARDQGSGGARNWAFNYNTGSGVSSFNAWASSFSATNIDTLFDTNAWTHVVARINSSKISIWLNGTMQSDVSNRDGNIATGAANFVLGANSDAEGSWEGRLDEVGIWNRSLSDSEIADLYNSGTGIGPTVSYNNAPEVTHVSPTNNTKYTLIDDIVLNVTITDDNQVSEVKWFVEGSVNQTNTSNINGTYILNLNNLVEGDYLWSVGAEDDEGEITNLSNYNFSLDFISPTVTLHSPANTTNTSSTSVKINATITDNSAIAEVKLFINGVVNDTDTSGVNGTYNWTQNYDDGYYQWSIGVKDDKGKISNSSVWNFTVDTTAPIITITELNYTYKDVLSGNITINNTLTELNEDTCWYNYNGTNITFTCSELGINFDAITTDSDIYFYANDTFGNLGSDYYSWTVTQSTFTLRAIDSAGDQINSPTTIRFEGTINSLGNPYSGLMSTWINESYPNYNMTVNLSADNGYYINTSTTVYMNATQDDYNISMTPSRLIMNFSYNNGAAATVTGVVRHAGGSYNFSGSSQIIVQENLSVGKVSVILNLTNGTNWTQFYEYDNQLDTNIREDILIFQDASEASYIGVFDESNSRIIGATVRVLCREANATDLPFILTHQRLVDGEGYTYINTDPDMGCRVIASADGYNLDWDIVSFGDGLYGTKDNALTFNLGRATTSVESNYQVFLPEAYDNSTTSFTAVVYAPSTNIVKGRTDYMADLGIEPVTFTEGATDFYYYTFTTAASQYVASNLANLVVQTYADGIEQTNVTMSTLGNTNNLFDLESLGLDSDLLNVVVALFIIIIATASGMVFASATAGFTALMIMSSVAILIDSSFTLMTVFALLYFAVKWIKGVQE